MAKPKVYVTRELPERGMKIIRERFEAEVWPEYGPPPKETIIEKARDVDALVTLLSDKIDAEVFDAAPKLKIVAQMAVGFDNIDVGEATKRGIYVTNTPGVLTETTADFAWALLMAVARRVVEADRYVRTGQWKVSWHPSMLLGRDVYDATLGIVGAGRIGTAVARRAKGFNMKILYYDVVPMPPEIEKELDAKRVDLDTLFKESDFVSIHVPLIKETYHLVNEEKLRLMKKTAYLINNSRGPVVDEKALYKALKEGWIAGAALDVFEQEPTPMDNPLLRLDNVVVAPHISSASHETRSRMAEMVAENLVAFFEGKQPPNLVNPDVLKVRPLSRLF
ncbi:MAG: glyoxylate reductase [Candidatus Bathyarchaeota archaeon]|jgi:glyoxylate reductase|nr:D-glycerate dehydrogenase [Candidatus Bathyarchaeota archaeon A05DMB-3]MDH7607285.1 glyoxylate reductase [Candidatus Bathyarchaeota archaeon]